MTAKFILGTKGKMTQVFDEAGSVHAATIIYAVPMTVTQVKTSEKDGYAAVQVGMGTRKAKNVSKAVLGHTKGAAFQHIRELRPLKPARTTDGVQSGGAESWQLEAGQKI